MLKGRIALVTGASGPIGAAIAEHLAKAGARVAGQYLKSRPGGDLLAIRADLASPGFEDALLAEAQKRLGPVDLLVNCAADQALQTLETVTARDMQTMLQINLTAALTLSRAFARQIPSGGGAITNISSIEAFRAAPGHGHYAASKAALENLTRALAAEFGPKGIRCNAVAPGLIHREGIEQHWPEGVARWKAACPLERLGRPGDIARAALFLSSPDAGWISGAVLAVDGGMSAKSPW